MGRSSLSSAGSRSWARRRSVSTPNITWKSGSAGRCPQEVLDRRIGRRTELVMAEKVLPGVVELIEAARAQRASSSGWPRAPPPNGSRATWRGWASSIGSTASCPGRRRPRQARSGPVPAPFSSASAWPPPRRLRSRIRHTGSRPPRAPGSAASPSRTRSPRRRLTCAGPTLWWPRWPISRWRGCPGGSTAEGRSA